MDKQTLNKANELQDRLRANEFELKKIRRAIFEAENLDNDIEYDYNRLSCNNNQNFRFDSQTIHIKKSYILEQLNIKKEITLKEITKLTQEFNKL